MKTGPICKAILHKATAAHCCWHQVQIARGNLTKIIQRRPQHHKTLIHRRKPPLEQRWLQLLPPQLSLTQGASTNADAIPLQLVAPNNYLIPPATLNKLQRSGYNIVLQVGWVQPSAQLNRTEHFHLLGGQSYPPTKDQANATTLGAQTTSAAYQNANTYQVNGDISISLNRFFNFKFNLLFTEPTTTLQK